MQLQFDEGLILVPAGMLDIFEEAAVEGAEVGVAWPVNSRESAKLLSCQGLQLAEAKHWVAS